MIDQPLGSNGLREAKMTFWDIKKRLIPTGRWLHAALLGLEWIPQVKRTEWKGPNPLKKWIALNTGLILQGPVQRQRGQTQTRPSHSGLDCQTN
mgnify:CR=1 FL=1